jgi:hypothetical protein
MKENSQNKGKDGRRWSLDERATIKGVLTFPWPCSPYYYAVTIETARSSLILHDFCGKISGSQLERKADAVPRAAAEKSGSFVRPPS